MALKMEEGVLLRYQPELRETAVTLPESIEVIEMGAFSGSRNLVRVKLPEGLRKLGTDAFSYCPKLASITVPGGVSRIRNRAFYQCSALRNVTICEGVRYIGDRAFGQCRNIGRTEIPQSVKRIGEAAFMRGIPLVWVKNGYRMSFSADGAFSELSAYAAEPSWLHFHAMPEQYRLACAAMGVAADPMIADWTRQHIRDVMVRVFPDDITSLSALLKARLLDKQLTAYYIKRAIAHTQAGGSPEPQMLLTHYQHAVFGEGETGFQL